MCTCLVAQSLRSAAAVSVQIKPNAKSEANGDNDADVVGHGQQHEVVGVEAVQRVKDRALCAVQSVLGGRLAREPGREKRHVGVV